ncbi:MAG: hypothetical protein L6V85_08275 [Clostridiales bacterium]|nr:MAG: hypothetical protein L6V85_08275 [Clostridiales bacterium]
MDYVRGYCEQYHSEVMDEYLDEMNAEYFGTDAEDTAYYYFKDSLAIDNLYRIKEQAEEYIVAAPYLYAPGDLLEEKEHYVLGSRQRH